MRPYLEKLFTNIGLVEWLKVKALNSSPSTAKKKILAQNSKSNSIYIQRGGGREPNQCKM
jgi:hypothetical protein